jgi:succinate dehydrogenase / fumarate reductase cytochrome b subunit
MLAKIAKLRFNTVVGKKIVMAITGLAMCLFLCGHLAGNLLLVWGKDRFNGYANFLAPIPLIPIIELGLLAILFLHVIDALVLLRGNYDARPVPYYSKAWGRSKSDRSKKTFASTFMMWSGVVILLFLMLHIWEMKYHHAIGNSQNGSGQSSSIVLGLGNSGVGTDGASSTGSSGKEAYDLAEHVINELRSPLVAGIYIFSLLALGLHLYHAVSSAFTSLGANHKRYQTALMWFGKIFTVVVCGGFLLIPVLILIGVVK